MHSSYSCTPRTSLSPCLVLHLILNVIWLMMLVKMYLVINKNRPSKNLIAQIFARTIERMLDRGSTGL